MRLHVLNTPIENLVAAFLVVDVLHRTLFCTSALPRLSSMASPSQSHFSIGSTIPKTLCHGFVRDSFHTETILRTLLHGSLTRELCHSLTLVRGPIDMNSGGCCCGDAVVSVAISSTT